MPVIYSATTPDELQSLLSEPGDHRVEVPITLVLTRFGLRSPRYLLPTYFDYQRVNERAKTTPGLLRSAFLIENPRTCYSLSIWKSVDAIPWFGTNVPEHVTAGNRIFGRLAIRGDQRPEIWSTKWQLTSVSNNLNWADLDLRTVIVDLLASDNKEQRHGSGHA